ncbi:MAG: purine-nucleoside phosphorylase, partial [Planctomycetes bacterium]|nr:purine-nucleoside phosphorylase [Planctomycetota bacterium]
MSAAERELVLTAADHLHGKVGPVLSGCRLGLVLGSGLKEFAAELQDRVEVPFADVPGWPVPKVQGHGGALVLGTVAGAKVACLTGRVHLYEGWTPGEVVRAVRTLRHLGVPSFLLTNAAGGIGDDMAAGDLMLIRDHLNLTGGSPLIGSHEPAFGPRFPDQTRVYSARLAQLLGSAGARV